MTAINWAIETDNLTKTFGEVVAVNHLNLQVPKGCIFGFLGENGAGKTTTIKLLISLLKPDKGQVQVLGLNPFRNRTFLNQRLGYMPESRAMYDYMKVEEIIDFTSSFYDRWDKNKVTRYLTRFELPLKRRVKHLSKGMRSQLALVLSLGHLPELLILDEPTDGMDPVIRHYFLTEIVNELKAAGITVFLSSHVLGEVEKIADQIGLIHRGKLLVSAPLTQLKEREQRVQVKLSRPVEPSQIEKIAGVIGVLGEGANWTIELQGQVGLFKEELSKIGLEQFEAAPLNLEEIFLRYAKGD